MNSHHWTDSVTLELPGRSSRTIDNTYDATAWLIERWPRRDGKAYQRAIRTCRLAIEGKKPPRSAKRAFLAAATEAKFHIKTSKKG